MKKGFTLIEVLLAVSIFTVIVIAFIGILSTITEVQVQSSSGAAVNQESQFLLQKLQYYVQTASLIDIPTSTATTSLKFDVASNARGPSYIKLATGTVYLQQNGGPLQPLTSNRVFVSGLSFTRHANPPGHDSVSISYTMSYFATSSVAQAFSQLFQTSIEQVSAATFDTALYASSNPEPLGSSADLWSPINSIMYFVGTNVGINNSSPAEQLSVTGGVQLVSTATSSITCNATARGTLDFYSTGGTTQDHLSLCAQAAGTTTVSWQTIY